MSFLAEIEWASFVLLCAIFTGLLMVVLLPWLAWSGLLTRANYVDDQPDTRILALSSDGELPPTALSCGDFARVERNVRPSRDAALIAVQQQDALRPPSEQQRARARAFITGVFHTERKSAVSSIKNELLPPQEISSANSDIVENGPRPDSETAIRLHNRTDETPQPAKERETRRRTRMIEVLHRAQQ